MRPGEGRVNFDDRVQVICAPVTQPADHITRNQVPLPQQLRPPAVTQPRAAVSTQPQPMSVHPASVDQYNTLDSRSSSRAGGMEVSDILGGMYHDGPLGLNSNRNNRGSSRPGGTSTPQNNDTYVITNLSQQMSFEDAAAFLEGINLKIAGNHLDAAGLATDGNLSKVGFTYLFRRMNLIQPHGGLLRSFHSLVDRLLFLLQRKWWSGDNIEEQLFQMLEA